MESVAARLRRHARTVRNRLAAGHAPLQHALLGIGAGVLTAAVSILFRQLFEWPPAHLLPPGHGSFEALSPLWLVALPTLGALLIGTALSRLPDRDTDVGVSQVLLAVHNAGSRLRWRNAAVQLLAGAACLLTGQSVGREGPAVHLGAAVSSLAGQRLRLPANSLRLLAGCGTAAAIAASFNTPITGVIFAMEVVLLQYTVSGFIPITLAAATATVIARTVYGNHHILATGAVGLNHLAEILGVAVLGLACGLLGAAYVALQRFMSRFSAQPPWLRLTAAGAIAGLLALAFPQILGVGYDTLAALPLPALPLSMLALLIVAKLVTTTAAIGLGMPGGLISPNLFLGACLGALFGRLCAAIAPGWFSDPSLYALLGMAATIGAVLDAPLAALMMLLEMTYSPGLLLPALVVTTVAHLGHHALCRQPSAFRAKLDSRGETLHNDPLSLALERIGVDGLMTTAIAVRRTGEGEPQPGPGWQVVEDRSGYTVIPPVTDNEATGQPMPAAAVDRDANLGEALDVMRERRVAAVAVVDALDHAVVGVLTRDHIARFLAAPITAEPPPPTNVGLGARQR